MEPYLSTLEPGIKDLVFALQTDRVLNKWCVQEDDDDDHDSEFVEQDVKELLSLVMFMHEPDDPTDTELIEDVFLDVMDDIMGARKDGNMSHAHAEIYIAKLKALQDTYEQIRVSMQSHKGDD